MRSVELLTELVSFPSVSSTSNVEVSRWAEATLTSLGFTTEWHEYEDVRGISKACVSGHIGPDQGRGLAYFCHTDVVPVSTWNHPASGPWELTQTDERVYGRGSCDMKGSLACMLAAVELLQANELSERLFVVCTADEEVGLVGAQQIVEHSAMFRNIVNRQCRGIIGEPTMLNVVHAHKGGRGLKITSRGVAAHSSMGKGVNANFAMIPFLNDVYQICKRIDGDLTWQDDRYDPPTININIGINDHTTAVNITPAQSICTVAFRTMPKTNADVLTTEIKDLASKHGLDVQMMFEGDPLFTDPECEYIRDLLRLTDTEQSHSVPYGTDGSRFTELNDLAVLGPGDIGQAHTDDEWISLDQMQVGTQIYEKLIRHWCTDTD